MLKKIFSKDIFVFILFFLIWFCIFRFTDSFTKGYNIYEDYSIINLGQKINNESFPSAVLNEIKSNLEIRARFCPVGDFHRLVCIKIFGTDFTLYTFYVVLLGILTSFFLYKFCIITGLSVIQSFLFGILLIAGPYSIIWTEISDYESLGMLLLSVSLFFSAKYIYTDKNKFINSLCFIIFLTLTSLCKENFIVIIPAVIFLFLWLYSSKNNIDLYKAIKKNYKLIFVLFTIMFILLLIVYLLVGINNQNYAGVETEKLGVGLILNYLKNLFEYNISFVILLGIFIVLFVSIKNKTLKTNTTNLLNITVLFILITFPQYVLYFKTGLGGRYLLPFMIGFSFYLVFVLKIIFDSENIYSFIKYLFLSVVIIFIFFEIKNNTIPVLSKFSVNCKATTNLAKEIINNSNDDSYTLFVMDPVQNFHEVFSLKVYLNSLKKMDNFKYEFIKRDYIHPFYSDTVVYDLEVAGAYEMLGKDLIDSVKNKNVIRNIIVFWKLKEKFLERNKNWFNEGNFRKENFGSYTLYTKH